MPTEQRLALKAQFPDAEHPVVRTHPETGEKILFVNAFTTHFTNFHTPENVRFGQDFAPGSALLLNYLISQATIPEYQVRWRYKKNSIAFWDNRVDPALCGARLLARGVENGARWDQGRHSVLAQQIRIECF